MLRNIPNILSLFISARTQHEAIHGAVLRIALALRMMANRLPIFGIGAPASLHAKALVIKHRKCFQQAEVHLVTYEQSFANILRLDLGGGKIGSKGLSEGQITCSSLQQQMVVDVNRRQTQRIKMQLVY